MTISTHNRKQAVNIVETYLRTRDFPDRMIESTPGNRGLLIELVYGTVRWLRVAKWVKTRFVKKEPGPTLEAILYISFYQLMRQEHPAEYAIVNESVQTAKELTNRGGANLVNAVLRNLLREKENVLQDLAKEPLDIQYSHPTLLFERWQEAYGPESTLELMKWNNTRAYSILRVCTSKISIGKYVNLLKSTGIEGFEQFADSPAFIKMPRGVKIVDLPGYEDGFFTVQDPSSALSTAYLNPQPGELVLDACAAPGGKTLRMAEYMENRGKLVALDLYDDRMTRLHENIQRLKLSCITPVTGDARRISLEMLMSNSRPFDRILLDVPCSNTGVIRRRPDSRWRFSKSRLKLLLKTQQDILGNTAGFLKPGGMLVYSTCSLEPEENTLQIARFLTRHPTFSLVEEKQIFPSTAHTDGAYAAKLMKK